MSISLLGLFRLWATGLDGWSVIAMLASVLLEFGKRVLCCSCATLKPMGIIKPRMQCSLLKLVVMVWAIGIVMYIFSHKGHVVAQKLINSDNVFEFTIYLLLAIAVPIFFVFGVGWLCEKWQRWNENKHLSDD